MKREKMEKREMGEKSMKKLAAPVLVGIILIASICLTVAAEQVFKNPTSGAFSNSNQQSASFSNPQYYRPGVSGIYSPSSAGGLWAGKSGEEVCSNYNDMLVQIAPLGCSPAVVRSDLLEEQNVPIFCKLEALKINPNLDINRIRSIVISKAGTNSSDPKDSGKYISGVSFYPARAALSKSSNIIGSPSSDNMGYVVVLLKQIPAEKDMPKSVDTKIKATIYYDTENSFGIGTGEMYLPVMTQEEWLSNYNNYGFWRGRGYLRAESLNENSASISIYSDADSRISSVNLERGKTSEPLFLQGGYCKSGVKLTLNEITYPKISARLTVDDDEFEVYEGGRFLNVCRVLHISSYGATVGEVEISCPKESFTLKLDYGDVDLMIDGKAGTFSVGKYDKGLGGAIVYSGNLIAAGKGIIPYIIIAKGESSAINPAKISILRTKLSKYLSGMSFASIDEVKEQIKASNDKDLTGLLDAKPTSKIIVVEKGTPQGGIELQGNVPVGFEAITTGDETSEYLKNENYDEAIRLYKEVAETFPSEKITSTERAAGEVALASAIELAKKMTVQGVAEKSDDVKSLIEEYLSKYPNAPLAEGYRLELNQLGIYNNENRIKYVKIDSELRAVRLNSVKMPGYMDLSVNILLDNTVSNTLGLNDFVIPSSQDGKGEYIQVIDIIGDRVTFKARVVSTDLSGKTSPESERTYTGARGTTVPIGGHTVYIEKINSKQVARVSLTPVSQGNKQEITFPFQIGIEKRAIKLSPDAMKSQIESMNESIEKLESLNENLAKLVTGWKGACLLTKVGFSFQDLVFGSSATDARKFVMRGIDGNSGWFAKCKTEMAEEPNKYQTIDACLLENNDEINKQIKAQEEVFKEYAQIRKSIRSQISSGKNTSVSATLAEIKRLSDGNKELESLGLGNEKINTWGSSKTIDPGALMSLPLLIASFKKGTADLSQVRGVVEKIDASMAGNEEFAKFAQKLGISPDKINYLDLTKINTKTNLRYNALLDRTKLDQILGNKKATGEQKYAVVFEKSSKGFAGYVFILGDSNNERMKKEGIFETLGGYKLNPSGSTFTVEDIGRNGYTFRAYSENTLTNRYSNPVVRFRIDGVPAIVPFDDINGWYVKTTESSDVSQAGDARSFILGNVGADGVDQSGDDIIMSYNINQDIDGLTFPGLDVRRTSELISYAKEAIRQAMIQKDKEFVSIHKPLPKKFPVDGFMKSTTDYEAQCQDFMSPRQCQILFNACDPVVCPSSRCNLGGRYKVDNVIQSGVIGSAVLCSQNWIGFGGDVAVPVCLTGLHAGLDGWVQIEKSYRNCMQESLDTGKTVGICDEIKSFYVCDFFVKQLLPIVNANGGISLFSTVNKAQKGGGEYLDVANALKNAEESEQYFSTKYAENSKLSFGFKSTDALSGEICKLFVSQTYPTEFDTMLDPESPPQFFAWFDEMKYSDVTTPPTSQYKVYYHIYAGNDSSVSYTVYLKDPPAAQSYSSIQNLIVDSGSLANSESVDQSKDFLSPAGYKQLCVRLNGQDHCGFGRVSTSYALNQLSDTYAAQQASEKVNSSKDCVSGTPSATALVNPNLQAGVEEAIEPEIYSRGIIRICASSNPGGTTDRSRWTSVGNCDEGEGFCWLDKRSVENAIKDKRLVGTTLAEAQKIGMISVIGEGALTGDEGKAILRDIRSRVKNLGTPEELTALATEIEEKYLAEKAEKPLADSDLRAEAIFIKAEAYAKAALIFQDKIKYEAVTIEAAKTAAQKTAQKTGESDTNTDSTTTINQNQIRLVYEKSLPFSDSQYYIYIGAKKSAVFDSRGFWNFFKHGDDFVLEVKGDEGKTRRINGIMTVEENGKMQTNNGLYGSHKSKMDDTTNKVLTYLVGKSYEDLKAGKILVESK